MKEELIELKGDPCPYCGHDFCTAELYKMSNGTWSYSVCCPKCQTGGPFIPESEGIGIAEVKAIEAWNALPRRLRFKKNDCAPEEPGNYWFRHPDWNGGAPFIVECYHSPNPPSFTGERILRIDGMEYHIDNDPEDAEQFEDGEWAGPIQEPEEKK